MQFFKEGGEIAVACEAYQALVRRFVEPHEGSVVPDNLGEAMGLRDPE